MLCKNVIGFGPIGVCQKGLYESDRKNNEARKAYLHLSAHRCISFLSVHNKKSQSKRFWKVRWLYSMKYVEPSS